MNYRDCNDIGKRFSGIFSGIRFIDCSSGYSNRIKHSILEDHVEFVEKAVKYFKIPAIGTFPIKHNTKYKPDGEPVQNIKNFIGSEGGYMMYTFFGRRRLMQDVLFFDNVSNFLKIQTWVCKYCEARAKIRKKVNRDKVRQRV